MTVKDYMDCLTKLVESGEATLDTEVASESPVWNEWIDERFPVARGPVVEKDPSGSGYSCVVLK